MRNTSMQNRRIDDHPTLRPKHQRCIDTSYVSIGWFVKRLVGQVNGLIEKGFMAHGSSIGNCGGSGHSYFPRAGNAFIFAVYCLSTPHNLLVSHL